MATKVLKDNNIAVPFRNKRISIIRGLDPLGLQNSSVRTYSLLLPGLNNVTGKIRYYSFYAWLLHQYFKLEESYTSDNQLQFIRFGEYILALLANIEDNIKSIPGSLHASREIHNEEHILIEHTFTKEGKTRGTYWTYKWGAFGQYYLGAMRDVGIINSYESFTNLYAPIQSSEIENISGEALAIAFDNSITTLGKNEKNIFLKAIHEDGKINNTTLKKLRRVFDFSTIESEAERQALLNLILQADYPLATADLTFYRRETILQLLLFLNHTNIDSPRDRDFAYYAYKCQGVINRQDNECMLGWYYYQFNEFWQYTNTAMLNGLLFYLKSNHGYKAVPLNDFLNQLTDEVLEELNTIHTEVTTSTIENLGNQNTLSFINQLPYEQEVLELRTSIEGSQEVRRVAYGFISIWQLFNENIAKFEKLSVFFQAKQLGLPNQYTSLGFLQKLPFLAEKTTLRTFIFQFLHKHIVHRHQLVAYKKMPSTMSQTTLKFQLEDNQIRFLMEFNPAFTGPRINNLIVFLTDLKILDDQKKLLPKGKQLLKQMTN